MHKWQLYTLPNVIAIGNCETHHRYTPCISPFQRFNDPQSLIMDISHGKAVVAGSGGVNFHRVPYQHLGNAMRRPPKNIVLLRKIRQAFDH